VLECLAEYSLISFSGDRIPESRIVLRCVAIEIGCWNVLRNMPRRSVSVEIGYQNHIQCCDV